MILAILVRSLSRLATSKVLSDSGSVGFLALVKVTNPDGIFYSIRDGLEMSPGLIQIQLGIVDLYSEDA